MSHELISRSPDLKRLRNDGYDIEVKDGYLLVKNIPYVNASKQVKSGTLVSALKLAGDVTDRPDTHVVFFAGDYPCHMNGSQILGLKHQSEQKALAPGLITNHSFSNRPPEGYNDYYDKMTRYVTIISGPAEAIDPAVTARIFPIFETQEDESVFNYIDTASSRAEISMVTAKLELGRVAIVGLGGTGSYVLDLVAKTPVKEIHLFDGDRFSQHNAFRSPGAPSVDELRQKPQKVVHFKNLYSKMHRHIVAHDMFLDGSTAEQLRAMDFVFLCLDRGKTKKLIVERLEESGTSFIDVGMGVELVDGSLLGVLRTTTSTAAQREKGRFMGRIPFSDGEGDNEYSRNIQIADLNALNASLAVVKWKKLYGFYLDLEREHFSTYTIDGNKLINEDQL